jgi:hypothetical protein
MIFRPELAEKVMTGEKTVTRRLASENPRSPWWRDRCAFKVGQSFAVCPGRGRNAVCRAVVTAVRLEEIGVLSEAEARAEGFASAREFEEAFEAINGAYSEVDLVWRVEFEVQR